MNDPKDDEDQAPVTTKKRGRSEEKEGYSLSNCRREGGERERERREKKSR